MPVRSPRDRPLRRAILVLLTCAGASIGSPANAFDPPKSIKDGWNGTLAFGAEATSGASRSSSLSFEASLTGRVGRFETGARARLLRSSASIEVARKRDGEPVLDAAGEPLTDTVTRRTDDRRSLSLEPRWFFTGKHLYAFALVDHETNPPDGVEAATRQVTGLGYRLWDSKKDYLAAGLGIGHKRLEESAGQTSDDGIGYLGVRLVLQLSGRARLDAGLDSDFGGVSNFTEVALALGYSLSDTVSLKFAYEARVKQGAGARADRAGRTDGGVDGRASLKLELDVL